MSPSDDAGEEANVVVGVLELCDCGVIPTACPIGWLYTSSRVKSESVPNGRSIRKVDGTE